MNAKSVATLPLTPLGRRGELNITRLVFGGAPIGGLASLEASFTRLGTARRSARPRCSSRCAIPR
jgi:hypothetical protein